MSGSKKSPPGSWICRWDQIVAGSERLGTGRQQLPQSLCAHQPQQLLGCPAAARAMAEQALSIRSPLLHRSIPAPPRHPVYHRGTRGAIAWGHRRGGRDTGSPGAGVARKSASLPLQARAALRGPAVMNPSHLLVYSSLQQMSPSPSGDSSSGGMLFQASPSNPY